MVERQQNKPRSQTRDAILQATSQVILEKGIEGLTLDAVAKKAEVSKGGLLYHFPNKESLIAGLIEKLSNDFEEKLQEEFDRDDAPGTTGQWLRAYIRASISYDRHPLALIAGLSSAITTNPELLNSIKDDEHSWQKKLAESGFDLVRATIIQLAMNGLWFAETFKLDPPSEPLRAQVIEALLAMTREPD